MTRSTGNTISPTTAPRLFVTQALREGADVRASAEQAHYLGNVLRRVTGDIVRLFNGADGEWTARVAFSRRDRATLAVETRLRAQTPEAGPWLVFGLLKRDATDLVVRQAAELGASRLLPVITERTNAARVNLTRLRAIAIEAAEQCERLTIPQIDDPVALDALLAGWSPGRRLFAAIERSWAGVPITGGAATGAPVAGAAIADAPADAPMSSASMLGHRPARPYQLVMAGPDPAICRASVLEETAGSSPAMTEGLGASPPSTVPPAKARPTALASAPAALLIGPEGGFTPRERELLSRLGFVTPISLGPFVLRAETAAAAGQALLLGMGWAEYVPST